MADVLTCSKATCKIAETGLCEENHQKPEDCPHFVASPAIDRPTVDDEIIDVSKEQLDDSENFSRLFYHGRALNLSEANLITRETPTQIVILAGEIESGKTTLLVEVYEKFQRGTFGGFLFSGSRTLLGFEQRCHLSRMISGNSKSNTERTREIDPEFLHLNVTNNKKNVQKNTLLFTDLSGERFKMVRNSTEECQRLKILARADHFAVLIDGALLSDKKHRQRAYEDCRTLLRSTVDARMLGEHTYVEIIFSKWDLIQPQKVRTEHTDFTEMIKFRLENEFHNRFGRLDFFSVAARANNIKSYPLGYKLSDLFRHWVNYIPEKKYEFPLSDVESIE